MRYCSPYSGAPGLPQYDLPLQFRVMGALADTEVLVPRMLWEERTGDVRSLAR